mgnify:CR=1 FL=1
MPPLAASEKKGGRTKVETTEPQLVPQLQKLVEDHTAGSPVEPGRIWTARTCESLAGDLADLGFEICANTVDRLLREELKLSRRQMEKTLDMDQSPDREAQFERMNQLKQYFLARSWPVLSIDTKKKELLGHFRRRGSVWTDSRLKAWDHDFPSQSWGKVIPYGVYDVAANEALVYLAQGADTGELACDAIRRWWHRLGKHRYEQNYPVLLLADCGGSNGYRVSLFREQLQMLSDRFQRTFRVCHLPPYCSKYNPIDHRVFCHLSRSLAGIPLTSVDVISKAFSGTTTQTGLRVVCELAKKKKYEAGRKASADFLMREPTQRDQKLSAYNYKFTPG